MRTCLHSTQKRIGLLAMWCCNCGALKLEDGEWRLPATPPDEPPSEPPKLSDDYGFGHFPET